MAEEFDAYHKWLGIPAAEQPPHHYRLLAIPVFEQDRDVIASAADRQMSYLRTFQSGPQSELSQRLLNEVSAARVCLLDTAAKANYDLQLKKRLKPAAKANGAKKTAVKAATSLASEHPGSNRSVWPVDTPLPEYHRAGVKSAASKASKHSPKQKSSAARVSKSQSPSIVAALVIGAAVLGIAAYFAFASRPSPKSASAPDKQATTKRAPAKKSRDKGEQSKGFGESPASKSMSDEGLPADFKGIVRQPPQPTPPPTEPAKPAVRKHDPTQPPLEESEAELARYKRGEAVDLLSLIDVARDGVHGEWRRDGDALISPGQSCSRIQIRYEIPDEYELSAVVERIAGDGCFNPGVVVGNSSALVVIDGVQGVSGLDEVDGLRYPDNNTVFQGPLMNDRQPHTIVCAVRRRAVRASCDGKLLFHWVGDPVRLTLTDGFQMPDPKLLSITDFQASFRITKYELRELLPPK